MKYSLSAFIPFIFVSCKPESLMSIGITGIVGLFILMFILFAFMFYLIAKRKKQGERSLVRFNNDVYIALNKLSTPQQKISMLETLIERINNDEKYKKDTEWRDKVLVKTYMHLSIIYYQIGDEMQTLNTCSKIIELDPKDGMAHYNRGSIYSNMGLYDKALVDLNQTIDLLPDYASAYNNRGLVHEKMEHYDKALADFSEAIKLENSPISYYNRGNTHYEIGKYSDALADYRSALENIDTTNDDNFEKELQISIKATEERIK